MCDVNISYENKVDYSTSPGFEHFDPRTTSFFQMVTQELRASRQPKILVFCEDTSCTSPPAMTVENAGESSPSRESVLTQLREITGVNDDEVLRQALEASKNESGAYNVAEAVNFLVDENTGHSGDQQQQLAQVPVPAATTKKTEDDARVIDLTSETSEKDEIQKAIALSLQDQQHGSGVLGGQVTAEEHDISMVLEQSLAESKGGGKRKRGEVWRDPVNPHERKRQGDWPVGLKNVGNTCWFSAAIQSLFHLPVFRHLVLNFETAEDWDAEVETTTSGKRNLMFMQELRNLFALMVATRRKYVDPSKAVDILKEAFQPGSVDSQQDVSEFTHKLLEWLEDAFKSDRSRPTSPASPENGRNAEKNNPMLDLFYGQFRSEGLNDGHTFSKEEKFGQYPLQVNGFSNIHESLEAAAAQEIESNNAEAMTKSGQEHWFTQLPPVLLFELSRFKFNQQLGRPEKIHNKFDFPSVIYMDRYLESNKNITRTKREEIKRLKERRDKLQRRLEGFLNFGSREKRFPLQDVLQYTLEFAETKPETTNVTGCGDVEMASPSSSSSMVTDSPGNSPGKIAPSDGIGTAFLSTTPVRGEALSLSSSSCSASPSTFFNRNCIPGDAMPAPRRVSDTELRVLQNCLRRWRTEVEHDVKELQDSIFRIDKATQEMYLTPSLQKVPYSLHAVLVHEGQAASGHYWAYVFDHTRRCWLKFNDVTVTDTTWEELQKESVGGYHNASAYCLMYIDINRGELVSGYLDEEEGTQQQRLSRGSVHLSEELRYLTSIDNDRFQREIAAWDQEQQNQQKDNNGCGTALSLNDSFPAGGLKRAAISRESHCHETATTSTPSITTTATTATASVAVAERGQGGGGDWSATSNLGVSRAPSANSPSHHQPLATLPINVAVSPSHKGIEEALTEAMSREMERLQRLSIAHDPLKDTRLQHIAVYLLANDVPLDPLIKWIVLEQFAHSDVEADLGVKTVAENKLAKHVMFHVKPIHRELYTQWQEDFRDFRKLAALFTTGLEAFHNGRYPEALPYLVNACALNDSISSRNITGQRRGLEHKLLAFYRRQCLLKLNDQASLQFEGDDDDEAKEALQLMNDFVVPCMNILNSADSAEADNAAADEIRSRWCSKLGDDTASLKREFLPEFLGRLLDPSSELRLRESAPLIRSTQDLSERFTAAMILAQRSGCLMAAYQSR